MKIVIAITAAMIAVAFAGCQSVTRVEFYEPTEANAEYSTPATDKSLGHGPVKCIDGKSGVPDFSDGKSFNLNLSAIKF